MDLGLCWKERNVHSDMNVMFRNHLEYFEKQIDFGELLPSDPVVIGEFDEFEI